MHKKFISSLVAGCLTTGLIFNPVAYAETQAKAVLPKPPVNVDGDITKAKFPLDKAIAKAKEAFNIGSDYNRFESGFNNYDGRIEWNLNWQKGTSEQPKGSVFVRINALTGEIVGMDRWDELSPGQHYSGLPQYSYEQAGKLASEWAQKLLPTYFSQTRLAPNEDQPVIGFGERGPADYNYNFVRLVNGIPFPEQNINIRVSGDTGQILGFNLNWDNSLKVPAAGGKISQAQAEKTFAENVELVYFRPNGAKDSQVKLVYRVKGGAGLVIDALTGKAMQQYDYYGSDKGMGGEPQRENVKSDLTPAEQAEVDKLKNIISAEKALEQIKKVITIPSELKLDERRLSQDYQYPKQSQWNFYWSDEKDFSYQSINAAVDAVTGEVLYFNKWQNSVSNSGENPRFTKEQTQKIAEDYIKKQQSKRFSEVRLENSRVDDYVKKGVAKSYTFTYTRLVNQIPFDNNGFEVRVNAITGEVESYRMTWWSMNFPNPGNLLGADKAVGTFLSDGGLKLEYLRTYKENQDQVNLVYRLPNKQSYMLDAQGGGYLNWNGEPLPPKQTNKFSDIAGHPAENDILQLAKANIAKSVDGKFYPDKNITKLEALEMLVASRGWYTEIPYGALQEGSEKEQQKKKLLDAAISLGIIQPTETGDLDKELTRLEFARLMINTLDYDGAAKLSGIFHIPTKDAASIPQGMQGYAALSLGLGLQSQQQGLYVPNEKVARGYAAMSLVRMMKVQK